MAALTEVRQTLWASIDNWSELEDATTTTGRVFERTFRFDEEQAGLDEIEPSISDLPALAIRPTTINPAWITHKTQRWPIAYEVILWTRDWNLRKPEDLAEKISNAIFRTPHSDGGDYSYVKAPRSATPPGTGHHPNQVGPITFDLTRAGRDRIKCTVTRITFVLWLNKNPFEGTA